MRREKKNKSISTKNSNICKRSGHSRKLFSSQLKIFLKTWLLFTETWYVFYSFLALAMSALTSSTSFIYYCSPESTHSFKSHLNFSGWIHHVPSIHSIWIQQIVRNYRKIAWSLFVRIRRRPSPPVPHKYYFIWEAQLHVAKYSAASS